MRYSPAYVAYLLSSYRRLSGGFLRGSDAELSADMHVAVERLRALAFAGLLAPLEVSALVGRFMLLQRIEDISAEVGVSDKTVQRATSSGLMELADALNGVPSMRCDAVPARPGRVEAVRRGRRWELSFQV